MTNNDKIKNDLAIGLDFVEKIMHDPDLLDEIPDGATINFLDQANPKIETKKDQERNRKYVKVKRSFETL